MILLTERKGHIAIDRVKFLNSLYSELRTITRRRERESESYGQRRLKICFVESFVPPFLEKKLFLERVSFEDRKGGKMWHVQFHEAILPAKGSAFSFKEAIKKGRKKLGQF